MVALIISHHQLTECTAAVALGYCHGLSKKEIASWLGKTESAVDGSCRLLYHKLGIHSQSGIAGLIARTPGLFGASGV